MNDLREFNPIPLGTLTLQSVARACSLAKKAAQAIPPAPVGEPYGEALHAARVQLESAHAVLEHLLLRATACN